MCRCGSGNARCGVGQAAVARRLLRWDDRAPAGPHETLRRRADNRPRCFALRAESNVATPATGEPLLPQDRPRSRRTGTRPAVAVVPRRRAPSTDGSSESPPWTFAHNTTPWALGTMSPRQRSAVVMSLTDRIVSLRRRRIRPGRISIHYSPATPRRPLKQQRFCRSLSEYSVITEIIDLTENNLFEYDDRWMCRQETD